MDIWIISAILFLTLYLLITEKISVDLTAIGIMVLLVVSRILTPKEAMFELAILGVPIAVAGIIFLYFAAPRILPALANPICQLQDTDHRQYLAELKIPEKSSLIGKNTAEIFTDKYPSIKVIELIKK